MSDNEGNKEGTPAFLTDSPAPVVETAEGSADTTTTTTTTTTGEAVSEPASAPAPPVKRRRLPQDVVGQLEDKLADDPNDVDAWWGLVKELKTQGKFDELREVYERMLKRFPTSAETWVDYIDTEMANDEFQQVDRLFGRCLKQVPNLNLWTTYLAYIRRRNDTKNGGETAINTVTQAYEFVLGEIGIDKDSGKIWSQYIEFIKQKSTPTTWEQQQQMDLLRKTYRRAIGIPLNNLEMLWQNYNSFEQGLNKQTARKFIAEKSALYMAARSAVREMKSMVDGIDRLNTTPRPRRFNNAEKRRLGQWMKWINWEKRNPLETSDEVVRDRVWYAYKQATLSMRYFPEVWFHAAEYAFGNGLDDEGKKILKNGFEANPCSFLLAYKKAEVEELGGELETMGKTFDTLVENLQQRREKLQESELDPNAQDITVAIANKMRCTNRSLGVKPARDIFKTSRNLPYITFHIFVLAAKLEFFNNNNKDVGSKIFGLGLKKFSKEAAFIKEYFDFLVLNGENADARALFEKSVTKMSTQQARPLYEHFLKYEANYGELPSLIELEKRYKSLYDNVDSVGLFADRNQTLGHDPVRRGEAAQPETHHDRSASASGVVEIEQDEPPTKRLKEDSPVFEKANVDALPQSVFSLLKQLPNAASYDTYRFDAAKLVAVIRDLEIPDSLL